MPLTDDDLAFMREVQAEHRPTLASLHRKVITRTPSGGQTAGYPGPAEPVTVRLDGTPDNVPDVIANQYEGGTLTKIVLDLLVDVRSGDRIIVSGSEGYELTTDGEPDRWATAQVVWARRYLFPARS